jgi:hypothetical protein
MKQFGTVEEKFGTVYLNYVEIGKTLEDLTEDNDQYIGADAFQPFNHYSSDFVVKLFDTSAAETNKKIDAMQQYYLQNQDFFVERGYTEFNHPGLLPLRFPVAEIIITKDKEQIVRDIAKRQYVNKVYFE